MIEHTGKRVLVKEVARSVTPRELLDAVAAKTRIVPVGTNGVLIRKLTRKQLLPNQSLGSAGIEDGETLLVDFERSAGGSLEFYPSGRIKSIQTEPEETPYLSDILREISGLHQIVENLEQRLAIVTAEIRDIKDSIVIVSGQDGASEMHMEPTNINKSGEPGIDSA